MFRTREKIPYSGRNIKPSLQVTQIAIPSIMHDFMTEEVTFFRGDKECKAKSYVDDIYLLFNQQRLSSAGTDTINAWLNTLTPKSDALAELRKKCSDDDLIKYCKSRYIQSPSELLAWSEFLSKNYDNTVARFMAERDNVESAENSDKSSVDSLAPAGE